MVWKQQVMPTLIQYCTTWLQDSPSSSMLWLKQNRCERHLLIAAPHLHVCEIIYKDKSIFSFLLQVMNCIACFSAQAVFDWRKGW